MRARLPIFAAVLVSALSHGPVARATEPAETDLLEEARVRLRTLRVRFEAANPAAAVECRATGIDDLEVSVRGKEIDPSSLLELDREPRPTIHALLVDTSASMEGWLGFMRDAVAGYAARLDPDHDRAMIVTLDDSVVLAQPPTSDRDALVRAIERSRMSELTALVDSLYYTALDLESRRERPVIVLITDGVDSVSEHDREDVNRIVERRGDMTVFTIGVNVPYAPRGGHHGVISARRFLERLAARTNGRFFDESTGRHLDDVYDEIRALLDSEAVLSFIDPDPLAEPGRVRVRSRVPGCRVVTYRENRGASRDERHRPLEPPYSDPPFTLDLPPDPAYLVQWVRKRKHAVDPACLGPGVDPEAPWRLEVGRGELDGCALDITSDAGLLYEYYEVSRRKVNLWLEQTVRPFHVEVPRIDALPTHPAGWMDALADGALARSGEPVRAGARQRPPERHARPYDDRPELWHGKVFLQHRARLARGMFAQPGYRAWILAKLRRVAAEELNALEDRFRRHAPSSSEASLESAARESPEGREALRRARAPSEAELQEYLAAWLGDISAHDIFVEWERREIDRRLASGDLEHFDGFVERWEAVRQLFCLPSYARVLALLAPVRDTERDVVGFWRITLPRPGWFTQRIKGWENRPDYSDLPLDLVPDRPAGLWVASRLARERPELTDYLAGAGYRTASVRYELAGKPRLQSPEKAFRNALVIVEWRDGASGEAALRARAEIDLGEGDTSSQILGLELEVSGDPALREIVDRAPGGAAPERPPADGSGKIVDQPDHRG